MQSAQHQLEARVSRGEMLQLYKEMERSMLQLADRQEAMFLTLKRQGRKLSATSEPDAVRKTLSDFDELFQDSVLRIRRWRLKILHLTNGGLTLHQLNAEVCEWNADQDNPRIGAHCFNFDWLTEQVRADTSMSKDSKTLFLHAFGLTDQGITRILGADGVEPLPAEAGVLEPRRLVD